MDRSRGEEIHLAHQARSTRRLLVLILSLCAAAAAGTVPIAVWMMGLERYQSELAAFGAFLIACLWGMALLGVTAAAWWTFPKLETARRLLDAGCCEEARYLLARLPASEEATYLLARAQEGAGDPTRAAAQYRLYLERHPRGTWVLLARERLGELARVRFSGRIHVGPRRAPEIEAAAVELAPLPPLPEPEPAVPGDEPTPPAREMREVDPARCPYCHDGFQEEDETQATCGACGTRHHAACYAAAGCAVNGCRNRRTTRESVA